jgi:hypothetical protein
MTFRNVYLAAALSLVACGGSSSNGGVSIPKDLGNFIETDGGGNNNNNGTDGGGNNNGTDGGGNNNGTDGGSVMPPAGSNQVAVVVDDGPTGGGGSANVGFVSVTLCAPGDATNCATIDHISVDTGSVGLRIVSSVIPSAVLSKLPVSQTSGKDTTECYIYADGYVFGTVRNADFTIGGETVKSMPFHAIGDKSVGAVPKSCSSACGTSCKEEDTVSTFGGNGIIGVAPYGPDCTNCTSASTQENPLYYTCNGTTCTAAGVPQASQLSNPISLFATDNNGMVLSFPATTGDSQASLTGSMTFGIGTQTNNAMPTGLQIYPNADIDSEDYLDIPGSSAAGKACTQGAYFDSGTNFVYFDDSALTACANSSDGAGLYCPSGSTDVSVPCTNTDGSGTKNAFNFKVGNATTIFDNAASTDSVFPTLVGAGQGSCAWGLPFFYGKNMFVGIEGQTVTGQTTPFEAY